MTVACVPTGMKTGVSTVACGRTSVPQRAADLESWAVTVNWMGWLLRAGVGWILPQEDDRPILGAG